MDKRLAKKIEPISSNTNWLDAITPVIATDNSGNKHYAVLAQDLQTVLPELVNKSVNGVLTVDYEMLTVLLLNEVKKINGCNCRCKSETTEITSVIEQPKKRKKAVSSSIN